MTGLLIAVLAVLLAGCGTTSFNVPFPDKQKSFFGVGGVTQNESGAKITALATGVCDMVPVEAASASGNGEVERRPANCAQQRTVTASGESLTTATTRGAVAAAAHAAGFATGMELMDAATTTITNGVNAIGAGGAGGKGGAGVGMGGAGGKGIGTGVGYGGDASSTSTAASAAKQENHGGGNKPPHREHDGRGDKHDK